MAPKGIFHLSSDGYKTSNLHVAHRLGVIVELNRTTGVNVLVLHQTFAYEYSEYKAVIVKK